MAEDDGEAGVYAFGRFVVDPVERRLMRDGQPVEINSRYFDALLLLVRRPGQLIERQAFLDQAWRGIPVTDEALSQAIAQLRKLLGDSPARPTFIATVPKHGYRFIAPVDSRGASGLGTSALSHPIRSGLATGAAASVGGAVAGMLGGTVYGFMLAAGPAAASVGAASTIIVLLTVGAVLGLVGGFGVGTGIGVMRAWRGNGILTTTAGGAVGGLVTGAIVRLIGLDAFSILLGRAPADVGGAIEGLVLGGAVAFGSCATRQVAGWPSRYGSAIAGGLGGALLALGGGRLFAGSLDSVAAAFPDSRIALDGFGRLFGESDLGLLSVVALSTLEGLLFGLGLALAVRRQQARPRPS